MKTKTSNGITYTTTGKLSGESDALSGDLSCKYSQSGATLTTKLFTTGQLTEEMVLENLGGKGLKLTCLGGIGPKQSLLATAEYVHPHLSVVTAANLIGSPAVRNSITLGMHDFTVGVQGDFNMDSKELKGVNGVLNYSSGKEHEATCMLLNNASKAVFTYSHIVSRDFTVAAEFEYDMSADTKVLTMGTKYEVDNETTLKTKIDSAGAFSQSYSQEIRKNTTLTLCSRFDVRNLEKPSHKFGLSLVIE